MIVFRLLKHSFRHVSPTVADLKTGAIAIANRIELDAPSTPLMMAAHKGDVEAGDP